MKKYYRILKDGEIIKKFDQFLCGRTWYSVEDSIGRPVGAPYVLPLFIRRPIKTARKQPTTAALRRKAQSQKRLRKAAPVVQHEKDEKCI